jgi:hypothetical protein
VAGNVTGSVGSVTGSVGSVTSPVVASIVTGNVQGNVVGTVASVLDRTGFSLSPTGLSSIDLTPEAGAPTTFRGMMIQLFRRFYRHATKSKTAGTIQTYADDGFTVLTTQAYTDDGQGNETIGTAS